MLGSDLRSTWHRALAIGIIWTLVIAVMSYLGIRNLNRIVWERASATALSNFDKDQAYRFWAATHGGVYVPQTENTPPNPYLSHVPERDITTPSGKKLTLLNPAYMLRQIIEEHGIRYGIKGHITSLNPLRPENAADDWETKALHAFESGTEEVLEFNDLDGEKFLRFMRPMYVQEGCLKCHSHQGYKLGDVRGGVSVSVPVSSMLSDARNNIIGLLSGLGFLWIIGLGAIVVTAQRITNSSKERIMLAAKYEDFYENAPDMYISVDAETANILRCNQAVVDTLGYDKSEIIGRKVFDMYHPDCMEDVQKAFQSFVETGVVHDIELILMLKDGSKLDVSLNVSAIRDMNGKILSSRSLWRDITKRKQVRKALEKSEERNDMALAVNNDGYYDWDVPTNDIFFDSRYYTMAGYEPNEFPGTFAEWVKRVHPEDYLLLENIVNDYLAGKIPKYDEEFRFKRKDGNWMWIRARVKIIKRDDNGDPSRIVGTHTDITDRKKAEAELYHSHSMLETAEKVAGMGSWEWDLATNHVTYSTNALEIYGIALDDYDGQLETVFKVFHPDDQEKVQKSMEEMLAEKKPRKFKYRIVKSDGEIRYIEGSNRMFFNDQGEIIKLIGHIQDVTERKKIEKELQETQMRYADFIEATSDVISCWQVPEGMRTDLPVEAQVAMLYESVCIESNRASWESFGFKHKEEVVGKKYKELVSSSDTADDNFIKFINNNYTFDNFGQREILLDGSEFYGLNNWFGMIKNGILTHVWASAKNITKQKKAEEELRKQLDELHRWHEVTLGREDRVRELKAEVNALLTRLDEPIRYASLKRIDVSAGKPGTQGKGKK